MDNKTIDINQRIPLGALEAALISFLEGNYTNDYVLEQLRLEFKGENRLKKAVRIVNKIIPNSPLADFLITNKEVVKTAIKNKTDKNIILISLLNCAFSFSFNNLQTLGKLFSAQEIVSRDALKKHLSKIYGGNRSTENAIDSVIPMYLEAEFFKRPKAGLYEWRNPLYSSSTITSTIYQESYKINNSITDMQDYQLMDPYFVFVN